MRLDFDDLQRIRVNIALQCQQRRRRFEGGGQQTSGYPSRKMSEEIASRIRNALPSEFLHGLLQMPLRHRKHVLEAPRSTTTINRCCSFCGAERRRNCAIAEVPRLKALAIASI